MFRPVFVLWIIVAFWASVVPGGAAEPTAIRDTPFDQDYREPFVQSEAPAENDVRSVAIDSQDRAWLATAAGLRSVLNGEFLAVEGGPSGPAYDVEIDGDRVWCAGWDGIYSAAIDNAKVTRLPEPKGAFSEVAVAPGKIAACGPDGLWIRRDGTWEKSKAAVATSTRDMLWVGEQLWMATALGVYIVEGDAFRRLWLPEHLLTSDAHALAAHDGRVYVGSDLGVDVYEAGKRVDSWQGDDGLPSTHVRSLAFGPDGALWIGATQGLARRKDKTAFRHSLRWLPADDVRDVAFAADGGATAATSAGLSILKTRRMTLAEKADHYEKITRARHVRSPGLVEVCRLKTQGDVTSWEASDTDNDGSFTGQYLASQAFRYAATKDPVARLNASAAFDAIEFLQTVTGTEGFIARTVIPSEWTQMADANRTYTPIEAADERMDDPLRKIVEVRWRKSADGRWLWKGDTSSDEISGHYYAWGVFYDLAADEGEKARIRDLARRVTDYIIAGDYNLRDTDGRPTQWAIWSPKNLNGDPNWAAERNTNSLEIIAILHAAAHLTGDKKYYDHAEELLTRHGYQKNLMPPQSVDLGLFTFIDSELLCMDFRSLMNYAPDEAKRRLYLPSVEKWFELNRRVNSPFYNFTFGQISGQACDAEQAVELLRDVPLDMIRWTVDNRHRADTRLVQAPQSNTIETERRIPESERAVTKWDGNHFQAIDGDDGRAEGAPTYWLMPYWMGRHYGYIAPPEAKKN